MESVTAPYFLDAEGKPSRASIVDGFRLEQRTAVDDLVEVELLEPSLLVSMK